MDTAQKALRVMPFGFDAVMLCAHLFGQRLHLFGMAVFFDEAGQHGIKFIAVEKITHIVNQFSTINKFTDTGNTEGIALIVQGFFGKEEAGQVFFHGGLVAVTVTQN